MDRGADVPDAKEPRGLRIPTHADFLLSYSTFEDHFSWRNTNNGSFFINSLCQILKEFGTKLDLVSVLTNVAEKMAIDFESDTDDPETNKSKQISCYTSSLRKSMVFDKKPDQKG